MLPLRLFRISKAGSYTRAQLQRVEDIRESRDSRR